MKELLKELFVTIRESSEQLYWTRGVVLSRENKVDCEKFDQDESIFRVNAPNLNIKPTTKIWLNDSDWNCDCGSKADPCEHVIASIITLKNAIENKVDLIPKSQSNLSVEYHFKTIDQKISFHRYLKIDEKYLALDFSLLNQEKLKSISSFTPNRIDITLDHLLKGEYSGFLNPKKWQELSPLLSEFESIKLDKKDIQFSKETIGFELKVTDNNNGVDLIIQQDHRIKTFFANGLALTVDNQLHVASRNGLEVDDLNEYKETTYFPPNQLTLLVSQIIPKYQKCIPTVIQSQNLPKINMMLPKFTVETKNNNNTLTVIPIITYGQPEIARVVDEKFIVHNPQVVPVRNLALEKKLLENYQRDFKLEQNTTSQFTQANAIKMANRLREWKGDLHGDNLDHFKKYYSEQLNFEFDADQLTISVNKFDVDQVASTAKLDISTVVNAWTMNDPLVPLLDGGWIDLPKNWMNKFAPILQEILDSKNNTGKIPQSTFAYIGHLFHLNNQDQPKDIQEFYDLAENINNISHIDIPNDLKANLREYQKEGIRWLLMLKKFKFGALLADDMGLGKTLQTIATLDTKSLIIAPTSVLTNWSLEIKKFRPHLSVQIYHGPNRKLDLSKDIIVTTYAIARIDESILSEVSWNQIVLDEAQNIKNPYAKSSLSINKLQAEFKICLTGTPIENRLEELWSQFNFINPGLLGSLSNYKKRYCTYDENGSNLLLENLKLKIKPFMLRRKKTEVLKELPPKTEMIIECELTDIEKNIYNALIASQKSEVLKKLQTNNNVIEALELLLRLRQACCSPSLIPGNHPDISSKVDILLEQLEGLEDTDSKALIFSQWTKFLDIIENQLKKLGVKILRIDGSTINRQEIVDKFQNQSEYRILLISLKAGGTGLNLTAADQVYIMDPWWNPAVEEQAADRAYRIGQTKPVIVKKLVAKDSIEEKIVRLQETKKQLSDNMISDQKNAYTLSKEDIINILNEEI